MKSIKRGWGKKADLAKLNSVNRMSYTLYGFPLAIQMWVYKAIPELGTRFATKLGDELPRMLRWSASRQPQSRSCMYGQHSNRRWKKHCYHTIRMYYTDVVLSVDVEDSVLGSVVRDAIQIQDGQPEDETIVPAAAVSKGKEVEKSSVRRRRRRERAYSDDSSESESDVTRKKDQASGSGQGVVQVQQFFEEVKGIEKENNDRMERRFSDFTDEIRARFDRVESRIENHACGICENVLEETREICSKIDDLAMKTRPENDPFGGIGGQYDLGGFNYDGGDAHDDPHLQEEDRRIPIAGEGENEQLVGNTDVVDDKLKEGQYDENADEVEGATTATVLATATSNEEIVAREEVSKPSEVPHRRARSSRKKIASASMKTIHAVDERR